MNAQLTIFDYSNLDSETRIVVQQRTGEIQQLMRRSAQDVIDIGLKLTEVKQRLGHGHFGKWLGCEFSWSVSAAQKFIAVSNRFKCVNFTDLSFAPSALYLLAAETVPDETIEVIMERAEAGETITHAVAKQAITQSVTPASPRWEPELPSARFERADQHRAEYVEPGSLPIVAKAPMVAPELIAVPDQGSETLEPIGISPQAHSRGVMTSAKTDQHYTPPEIMEAVYACLGEVDLDPCSNSHESPNVKAHCYYTREDNGLTQPWGGKVFMNPPYSIPRLNAQGNQVYNEKGHPVMEPVMHLWTDKLLAEYRAGRVQEAIALVKGDTSTQWHQKFGEFLRCECSCRVKFIGNEQAATFSTHLFYLGPNNLTFYKTFSSIGAIVRRVTPELLEAGGLL